MIRILRVLFTKKIRSSLVYALKRVLVEHMYKEEISDIFVCLTNKKIDEAKIGMKYLENKESQYLAPILTKCEVLITRIKIIGK